MTVLDGLGFCESASAGSGVRMKPARASRISASVLWLRDVELRDEEWGFVGQTKASETLNPIILN